MGKFRESLIINRGDGVGEQICQGIDVGSDHAATSHYILFAAVSRDGIYVARYKLLSFGHRPRGGRSITGRIITTDCRS